MVAYTQLIISHMQHTHNEQLKQDWSRKLPWHSEEEAVKAVNICQLHFFSLEGLQIFNLKQDNEAVNQIWPSTGK